MKFYITFYGPGTPGARHYVVIEAACEESAIHVLIASGHTNWSNIYKHERYVRRLNLIEWRLHG